MPVEFRYPNLAKRPAEWSSWVTPRVGEENSTVVFPDITLDLKEGDKVVSSVDVELDGFWATGDGIDFWAQGAVDGKWIGGNVVAAGLCSYDVTKPASFVETRCHTNTANANNAGSHEYGFGIRVDDAGGRYRLRHLMVEVNPDEPHAWAPAEGEVS